MDREKLILSLCVMALAVCVAFNSINDYRITKQNQEIAQTLLRWDKESKIELGYLGNFLVENIK